MVLEKWWYSTLFHLHLLLLLFRRSVMSDSLRPHGLQHTRLPCPSLSPWVCSNSCLLSPWCHPTILSSVSFSSCLQSFPASGSFLMSWLFTSGGQSIGASASASVLPLNIWNWSPLELTGWISLQCKGLSRVFSNTTVRRHQFFGSLLHGPTLTSLHDYHKNHSFDKTELCQQSLTLLFHTRSSFGTAILPRSKCLLIAWLQSLSSVILEPKKIKSVTVSIVSPSICHEVMGPDVMILLHLLVNIIFICLYQGSTLGKIALWS